MKISQVIVLTLAFTQQLWSSALLTRREQISVENLTKDNPATGPQPITEHVRIVKMVYDILNPSTLAASPATSPVTSPATSPATSPVTSPVTGPATIPAMNYTQLMSALGTVTPYTIYDVTLANNNPNPSFFNFNVGTAGYALLSNPWNNFVKTVGVSGIAVDITPALNNANLWALGVTFVLVAFDAKNNIIASGSAVVPVSFALYIFDSKKNLLNGSPFTFPATNLGTGTVSTTSMAANGVAVGGLGSVALSMNYPFALTATTTPAVGTVTASTGVQVYPYNKNVFGTTLPTASIKSNMSKIANGGNAVTIPNGTPLTLLSVNLSDSTGWLVFEFDKSALAAVPVTVLSDGLYVGIEQTVSGGINTVTVVLMDSSQNVYASGSYVSNTNFMSASLGFNLLNTDNPLIAGQAVLNQVAIDGTVVLFKAFAMTYAQLTSALGAVNPYSIDGVFLSENNNPSFFNFNVGTAGYAFISNPWSSTPSSSTAPNGVAADIASVLTTQWASGVTFMLVAFDSNRAIIPSASLAVPVYYALYIFDSKQNAVGSPFFFPATNLGSGTVSTLSLNQTGVIVGGLGASAVTMKYPFALTASTVSAMATIKNPLNYQQLMTALGTVTPSTINLPTSSSPSFININIGTAAYAFFQQLWVPAPAGSTAPNGIAADITPAFVNASVWSSGVTFVFVAFDQNNAIISSGSQAIPASFAMYIFDKNQNALPGSPFAFLATNIGTGSVSTAPISSVDVGGLSASGNTLTYPFALTVVTAPPAAPAVTTIQVQPGITNGALMVAGPLMDTNNLTSVSNTAQTLQSTQIQYITVMLSSSYGGGQVPFTFDATALSSIPVAQLKSGIYVTISMKNDTAIVTLSDSTGAKIYASGVFELSAGNNQYYQINQFGVAVNSATIQNASISTGANYINIYSGNGQYPAAFSILVQQTGS